MKPRERPKAKRKSQIRWEPHHYAFIETEYQTHTIKQLAERFFEEFGLRVSASAIGWKLWARKVRKTPPRAAPNAAKANPVQAHL